MPGTFQAEIPLKPSGHTKVEPSTFPLGDEREHDLSYGTTVCVEQDTSYSNLANVSIHHRERKSNVPCRRRHIQVGPEDL